MNTPKINSPINPEDPKWTAYVLGELDEAERAEIEHLLETSAEARTLVEELNLATMTLKDELAPLAALALTQEQKAAIYNAVQPAPRRWFGVAPAHWGLGLAAAAILALTVWVGVAPAPPLSPQQVAQALPEEQSRGTAISDLYRPRAENSVQPQSAPALSPASSLREAESKEGAPVDAASMNKLQAQQAQQAQQGQQGPGEPQGQGQRGNESNDRKEVSVLNQVRVGGNVPAPAAPVAPPPTLRQVLPGPGPGGGIVGGVFGGQIDNPALVGATGAVRQQEEAKAAEVSRQATPPPTAASAAAGAAPAAAGGRGGGAGGGGRGGGARGGAAGVAGRGAGVNPESSLTTGTLAGDALLRLPNNEADLQRYLSDLAAARGVADGNIRVDGFDAAVVTRNGLAAAPPPPPPAAPRPNNYNAPGPNTEAYDRILDNPFIRATQENLATFSIDVDTASYANMRRFLTQNQMPPRDAVRIEELINYFNYDYAQPRGNDPIAPNMEVASTPWNPQSRLVRIGIKAREINANRRPPSNLVFLIDVSGSMNQPAKLPLVKAGLKMMVDRLGENDTVSIVVYAGASGLVLPPTSAIRKEVIQQAIDRLQPGGSTNGASGIQLAYNQAVVNFIRGGTNRVILMTDGDFNVGVTNQGDLTRLIEGRAKSGVFLSVLGFGMGNIKDSTLEKLADQGNGHYAYIDNINEARKVLVEEMGSTLVTIAKDVKIQVDFNPARVEAYRLIGYENRILRTEDFNNDLKDAGDMGAGHTVTALFEVVPKGGYIPGPSIDPSKYTLAPANAAPVRIPAGSSSEMLTLRVRYKLPEASTSTLMDVPLVDQGRAFPRATADFRFAASVAEFGMILRDSPYRGNASIDAVLDIAEGSRGQDRNGYRQEFIELVQRAKRLR